MKFTKTAAIENRGPIVQTVLPDVIGESIFRGAAGGIPFRCQIICLVGTRRAAADIYRIARLQP